MIAKIDRKRVLLFVAVSYLASLAVALVIWGNGGLFREYPWTTTPLAGDLLSLLMFAPALAHLLARVVTCEGFSQMLLRPNLRRGWPFYPAALLLPALANLLGGALYYLLFPGRFDPSMAYARETLGLIAHGTAAGPLPFLLVQVGYAILLSLPTLYVSLGEELGWRAYLQPKLMPLGPRRALLLVGAVWAVWHWPATFLGLNYLRGYWGEPLAGPLLWVWTLLPVSVLYGWLTLRSGSVWPAALAHGVHNATCRMMLWFLREPVGMPVDVLVGPLAGGVIGSLGYFLIALPILLIPSALTPRR